jgi:deoxyribodipyrimidine photo-lyase
MTRRTARAGGAGTLVWFRRDLRDFDHAALASALDGEGPVFAAFIFDRAILDALPREDRRVEFIADSLAELDATLRARGGGLLVRHGYPADEIPSLAQQLAVAAVHANRDHEPYALARDKAVARTLRARGIRFETFNDHLIRAPETLLSKSGTPYTVFTPYRAAWLAALTPDDLLPKEGRSKKAMLARPPAALDTGIPSLESIGFSAAGLRDAGYIPGMSGGAKAFAQFRRRIERYRAAREFPAVDGTSRLSVHLRFGTVSIRTLVAFAHARSLQPRGDGASTWLSELAWREFFSQILWHFPHVVKRAFNPRYAALRFRNDRSRFAAWCEGRTGYPLVDAAMRQLNTTGFMHNRLRMVAASFLVKDLLIDWRWGERYFAQRLLDYELATNNGSWQWAASTGCDAQPWFRIFNPVTQSERFDAQGTFIRRFVPELARLDAKAIHAPWLAPEALKRAGIVLARDYPTPIVDHAVARAKALALFASARAT